MALALTAALLAAACFGVATVLQAIGVRANGAVRAMVSAPFIGGLALDGLGFVFELVALRMLPLYLVQAAVAGSLAVTAVTGAVLLKSRLGRAEWGGVIAVCAGLALLGITSGEEGHRHPGPAVHWVGLGVAALLGVLGLLAARGLKGAGRAAVLGAIAGLGYGDVSLSVRLLPELHMPFWSGTVLPLLREPATYALIASGAVAFALLAQSLVGGRVAVATAGLVLGETAVPAVLGVWLLGDTTRHGMVPIAVLGFLLAVAGALALARFGEVDAPGDAPREGNEEPREGAQITGQPAADRESHGEPPSQ
ncbi:hypothetical protein BIV57_03720 [Mangrovactinospora gilvigrisea]|uniref:Integral membrane protein n=1 Tax=Mangrovactinospora gilvigrisea TaxID=1428644 RepID=A0A1J7BJJ6_9ACTN|nr:hypothetical protein [Mangrovactinospora gilvigrisea]OIV38855.1 hypothetical protein BIV57_03720 [Mangrovactinospora gilvigrisea]